MAFPIEFNAARVPEGETIVLPLFDYADVIYKNARKVVLEQLDVLYHAAIRLITKAPYITIIVNYTSFWTGHHCIQDGKFTVIFLFIKFCQVYYLNIFNSCWNLILIYIYIYN